MGSRKPQQGAAFEADRRLRAGGSGCAVDLGCSKKRQGRAARWSREQASARLSLCLSADWLLAIFKQFSVVSVNKATLFSARGMEMRFRGLQKDCLLLPLYLTRKPGRSLAETGRELLARPPALVTCNSIRFLLRRVVIRHCRLLPEEGVLSSKPRPLLMSAAEEGNEKLEMKKDTNRRGNCLSCQGSLAEG